MEPKNQDTSQSAASKVAKDIDLKNATAPNSGEFPGRGKPVPRDRPFPSATLAGRPEHAGLVEGTIRILPAFDEKWDKEEFADYPTTLEEQQERLSIGFERTKDDLKIEYQETKLTLLSRNRMSSDVSETPADIDKEIRKHEEIFKMQLELAEAGHKEAQAFLSRCFSKDDPFTAEYAVYRGLVLTEKKLEENKALHFKELGGEVQDLRMSFQSNIVSSLVCEPIPPGTILVGKRISSSHLKHALPKENIVGFITEQGAAHAKIQAATFGWAAITYVKGITEKIKTGEIADGNHIFMDGGSGSIWLNPTTAWIAEFHQEQGERIPTNTLTEIQSSYALTRCREEAIHFSANINRPEELADIQKVWPDGSGDIGLFRTEEVIDARRLERNEEGQFRLYQPVLKASNKAAPIFRLIDWGGEKSDTGFSQGNPQLEDRGIRHSLLNEETRAVLRVQLRALLRASEQGPVAILAPMVTHAAELRELKNELHRARKELAERNIFPPVENVTIGAMIETPAAVRGIHPILKEVQFVNIGSEDLTQYLLAASRGFVPDTKGTWTKQFGPHHPIVLEAIHDIIHAVDRYSGKKVHGCGHMFSMETYAPLTVGLNVGSISLPPRTASEMYEEFGRLDYTACQAFVGWAMHESDGDPVLVHDELERFHECVRKGELWEPPTPKQSDSEQTQPEPIFIRT